MSSFTVQAQPSVKSSPKRQAESQIVKLPAKVSKSMKSRCELVQLAIKYAADQNDYSKRRLPPAYSAMSSDEENETTPVKRFPKLGRSNRSSSLRATFGSCAQEEPTRIIDLDSDSDASDTTITADLPSQSINTKVTGPLAPIFLRPPSSSQPNLSMQPTIIHVGK